MLSTRCEIEVKNEKLEAIVDSGAATNILTKGLQEKLGIKITESSNGRFKLADGKRVIALGQTFITVKIGGIKIPMRIQIIDSREKHLILGTEILKEMKAIIDYEKGELKITYDGKNVKTPITFTKEKIEIFDEESKEDSEEEFSDEELNEEINEEMNIENSEEEYEEEWEDFNESPAYYLSQLI